jgi:RNA polymerase sigma factor (sigma-70 family)
MLDLYTTLKPVVARAARSVSSKFPSHHDADDTEQAIWVWAYENEASVSDLIRTSESWERQLYSTMTKVAHEHLWKEDQATYGYSREDTFSYPKEKLESILEMVFEYEDWQSFAMKVDMLPRSKGQANETGDNIAEYADVKSAVEKLPDDQYNVILWRYKYHFTYDAIGEELGISKQAANRRVSVAVNALQRSLGQEDVADLRRGYSGRTERPGIAESQYLIETQYEG